VPDIQGDSAETYRPLLLEERGTIIKNCRAFFALLLWRGVGSDAFSPLPFGEGLGVGSYSHLKNLIATK